MQLCSTPRGGREGSRRKKKNTGEAGEHGAGGGLSFVGTALPRPRTPSTLTPAEVATPSVPKLPTSEAVEIRPMALKGQTYTIKSHALNI